MKVDTELMHIYQQAYDILKQYKDELLKYNDTTSLKKMMYNIEYVKINPKTLNRRGCMKYIHRDSVGIEISGYMMSLPEKEILTTMVHELLHCFKDSNGHKGTWKWRANILKEKTGLDIQRVRTIEGAAQVISEQKKLKQKPIMQFRCQKCGQLEEYTSNCKFTRHPELYTHRHCGGHYERVV